MIANLTIILIFQLIGEGVARVTGAPAPGPIIGMVLLFLVLLAAPSLAERLRPTANGLLSHLALLFVPAGVGVIGRLPGARRGAGTYRRARRASAPASTSPAGAADQQQGGSSPPCSSRW